MPHIPNITSSPNTSRPTPVPLCFSLLNSFLTNNCTIRTCIFFSSGIWSIIKDEKSIRYGTIISTIFAIVVSCGCYFLGGFARLFDTPAIHAADGSVIYDAIIPTMLSSLSDILIGIVIVLVLSFRPSNLHRTAYGNLLGSIGWCILSTISVWIILERRYKSSCLGKLYFTKNG